MDEAIIPIPERRWQINPDYAEAHNNLGTALLQKGRWMKRLSHYQKALQIKPDYAEAHDNLGIALRQKGRVEEAIAQFQAALQIKPDYAEAHINFGNALLPNGQSGRSDSPITKRRCKSIPATRQPTTTSATLFCKKEDWSEAMAHFQKALQIEPD